MHWNKTAVQRNPGEALWLMVALTLSLRILDIFGLVLAGYGTAVTNSAEALAAWPVDLLMVGIVAYTMHRRGYLLPGGEPRPWARLALFAISGALISWASKPQWILEAMANYTYFQYADYPTFLAYQAYTLTVRAPVVEEVLFRGLLFGALRQRSRVAAYLISAAVFVLWHVSIMRLLLDHELSVDLPSVTHLFLFALLCAYCYERTQHLIVPMVLHALSNSATVLAPALRYGYALWTGEASGWR